MSHENVQTVQRIYAAFGKGDVATILGHVADDTRWSFNGGRPDVVPFHAPRHGKEELPAFFRDISGAVEFAAFEPREFLQSGPHIVVEVQMAYVFKRTGKRVEQSQLHFWTFDAAGKVARLVHYEDTAQVLAAAS